MLLPRAMAADAAAVDVHSCCCCIEQVLMLLMMLLVLVLMVLLMLWPMLLTLLAGACDKEAWLPCLFCTTVC